MDISEIDIIKIDSKIKSSNKKELEYVNELEKEKEYLIKLIEKNKDKKIFSEKVYKDLEKNLLNIENEIKSIIEDSKYDFYVMKTHEIIENYKKILEKPAKISFFGKTKIDDNRESIIREYIDIVSKYYDFEFLNQTNATDKSSEKNKSQQHVIKKKNCSNQLCKSKIEMEIEEEKYVCRECGLQEDILGNMTSYKDINRVNITYKFTYERIVHFKDCINQYQGKQNSTIDESVYEELEKQFETYGLLVGDKNTPRIERFKNITKEHILMFLKETGNSNNYEHVFLIYNTITGKKNDDISHLEKVLLEDFEILSNLYDKKFKNEKKIDRKSFINTQYVLFQLLRKHKYPCKKEDFNILKTLDRKSFHDDILSELFQELSWDYIPCF